MCRSAAVSGRGCLIGKKVSPVEGAELVILGDAKVADW